MVGSLADSRVDAVDLLLNCLNVDKLVQRRTWGIARVVVQRPGVYEEWRLAFPQFQPEPHTRLPKEKR